MHKQPDTGADESRRRSSHQNSPPSDMTFDTTSPRLSRESLYVAFRSAYLSTFQLLVSHADESANRPKAYLERIPILDGCALQVQIDCLLKTWQRVCGNASDMTITDHCVCYAAAGELARFGETENLQIIRSAMAGPQPVSDLDCIWLASRIRTMQIIWPISCAESGADRTEQVLMTDLDSPPVPESDEATTELLNLVGRWQIAPKILANAEGLLTDDERSRLGEFLQKHPQMMNL